MAKKHSQGCNSSQDNKIAAKPAKEVRTEVVKNAIVGEKTIDNVFDDLTDAIELIEQLPLPEKERIDIHNKFASAYNGVHNIVYGVIEKYSKILEADIASRQKELDSQQVLLDQTRKYLGQKKV
jgi:hypothetical protein